MFHHVKVTPPNTYMAVKTGLSASVSQYLDNRILRIETGVKKWFCQIWTLRCGRILTLRSQQRHNPCLLYPGGNGTFNIPRGGVRSDVGQSLEIKLRFLTRFRLSTHTVEPVTQLMILALIKPLKRARRDLLLRIHGGRARLFWCEWGEYPTEQYGTIHECNGNWARMDRFIKI